MLAIHIDGGWKQWRDAARRAVRCDLAPNELEWTDARDGQTSLLGRGASGPERLEQFETVRDRPRVPNTFVTWGRAAAHHRDPARWALLYRVLWRLAGDEPRLLQHKTDEHVDRLRSMYKAVKRDAHKMKAFVRFREVEDDGGARYVAWHEPDHFIVPYVAPFFADRFATMHWTIFTPEASVSWDGESLAYGRGVDPSEAPDGDDLESMWKTYYGAIFNPARIKTSAMKAEMPVKHWSTLPETAEIPKLLREAPRRVREMAAFGPDTAASSVPDEANWQELEEACLACTACDRCREATQAVFGEGDRDADLAVVGEQPGAEEDRRGRPFVGPAGDVLDRALDAAALDRDDLYLTNSVKHYGSVEKGGTHYHDSPDSYVTEMCEPWVRAELELLDPDVVVALGRTAATVLAGRQIAISREHGRALRGGSHADAIVPTYHPAAVLRQPGDRASAQRFNGLVEDLRTARARAT
jgi:DNA polymerase